MDRETKNNKLKAVVVDDDPITKMNLEEMLDELGYELVGSASDGFDAIDICRKTHPDFVLMDIEMPFLDGISATKIIVEENLAVTVIMLTGFYSEELIRQAKECGAGGYLIKPVDKRNLVSGIEIAVCRSLEVQSLRKDIKEAKDRLESRVVIEKAKGKLMTDKKMDEQSAYDYIRTISRTKQLSMRQVSEIIISRSR